MRCRSCNSEVPQGAAFCPKCGARQEAGAEFETIDRMIEDYRRRLDDKPDDADARFNLALAYKHKGLDELALAELARLRDETEGFVDLEYEMAALYLRRGELDQAREAAQRALAIEPDHRSAKRVLARIEQERG